ncbi:MAG TPA: hypothetical protein VG815_00275 [Chloroflexota bacterium]|nr:hypothetical protein [Chloroflexota bacterium]
MGLFKSMKDMRDMVNASPDMIREAQALGAQAQELQAAQQVAMQQQLVQAQTAGAASQEAGVGDFEPIAGVSLETYTQIAKGLAEYNYDQTKGPVVALAHGVDEESWSAAVDGWNLRMRANKAVAQRFNAMYTGRA